MDDYQFDTLGWFLFERLVQGLLKAELGLTVESWGGRGDWGRDAWCAFPLALTKQSDSESGPFLFQLKFVEHANAAGARPASALKHAVAAEVTKLGNNRNFIESRRPPRHYIFITNAPLSPASRTWIMEQLSAVYPGCQIHTWGGKDLADILHSHPKLCRAYPEILSLRNLDTLLGEVVNRDILNRSADALAFARDLAPAFVATATYFRAFEALGNHHFVVLDGPPEMGKTAIARMIGLVQVAVGWEAFECQEPQDIDRVFQTENPQVFIADDAFGRTEYDPLKGHAWEHAIPRLLHRLDGKHWLIWTSRKHILERALSKMDLQAPARKFPDPGEVVVTAGDLRLDEKALILYRHAKAAGIGKAECGVVKAHAKTIVQSSHFTPERIRRLCDEKLPQLGATNLNSAEIANAIQEAINNPTTSMQKAYRGLPEQYRWLLIAKLGRGYTISLLRQVYEAYVGPVSDTEFRRRLDDLDGTFVRRLTLRLRGDLTETVDWVHPSFRDLVIDELADDLPVQERYWRHADISGVAIALSESGGALGVRRWPFLGHEHSWAWFGDCCERLAGCGAHDDVRQLLAYLVAVWKQPGATHHENGRLIQVASRVLSAVSGRWASDLRDATESMATIFSELSFLSGIAATMPDLGRVFMAACGNIETMDEWGYIEIPEDLDEWLNVCKLLKKHQPEWFLDQANADAITRMVAMIEGAVTGDLEWSSAGEGTDAIRAQAEHLRSISSALSDIQDFLIYEDFPRMDIELADRCDSRANSLEVEAADAEPDEPDTPMRTMATEAEPFDLQSFFADL